MSRRYFNYGKGIWVKQCSCCNKTFEGTASLEESHEILLKYFGPSTGCGTADGMQSRCMACNQSKRRALGVTLETLRDMLEEQEGCCAICEAPISLDRGVNNPANLDHNEETNQIRSLLCGNCNRGIGLFYHRADWLRSAADYVERHEITVDE